MVFYNPCTKSYYKSHTYKLDPSCLPSTVCPFDICYDGGIIANLYRDNHPHLPKPYPPGCWVHISSQDNTIALIGTVSNIPLKTQSGNGDPDGYMILLDDGTMHLAQLCNLRPISDMLAGLLTNACTSFTRFVIFPILGIIGT